MAAVALAGGSGQVVRLVAHRQPGAPAGPATAPGLAIVVLVANRFCGDPVHDLLRPSADANYATLPWAPKLGPAALSW